MFQCLYFCFYQCFPTGLCRVRSQCGRPAPDHVWGTWGNHPAQQPLTHKQINHSTPGLSHLSASHVGGPPCPNSLSFMYEDRETRDKKDRTGAGDGGQLWEPHPTNTSLWWITDPPSQTHPTIKPPSVRLILIYHGALVAVGLPRHFSWKQRGLSVLSLSRNMTLWVSHSTTFILCSVQIH